MIYAHYYRLLMICIFILCVSACKPDSIDIDLFTSDIDLASNGEIVQVPLTASFSMLGKDDENLLSQAVEISKKYLSENSEFHQSKGDFGDRLVINTKIPLGTTNALNSYLIKNPRLAVLSFSKGEGNDTVHLLPTASMKNLHKELNNINFMLGIDFPAKKTNIKVISDGKKSISIFAVAVFVSKKPYLNYDKVLNKRDSVEITFTGGEESVYSEQAPVIYINNK